MMCFAKTVFWLDVNCLGRNGHSCGDRFGLGKPGYCRASMGHCFSVIALDFVVDFLPMDRHVGGRFDADFDDLSIDAHDLDSDLAIDDDAFVNFAR